MRLPLDVVAGLQVAIANVAEVAQASVGEDVPVMLAQGQRVTAQRAAGVRRRPCTFRAGARHIRARP